MGKNILYLLGILNIVMLLIATLSEDLSYGYYTLLRLVEFTSCCTIIIHSVRNSSIDIFTLLFGLLGPIFNPIIKVTFEKEIWLGIDSGASILWGVFLLKCIIKNDHK